MWSLLARNILRNRTAYLVVLIVLTAILGFFATKIELSYDFAKILPSDDKAEIVYTDFKKIFGEDGAVMVIGYKSDNIFDFKTFNNWASLSDSIKKINGIQNILSIDKAYGLKRNDSLQKFDYFPIVTSTLQNEAELDSIKAQIMSYPFYKGLLYNDSLTTTLMAVTFDKKDLNSKNRLNIVKHIKELGDAFAAQNKVEIHYSGLPYIRSEYMRNVQGELSLFMALAFLVTIVTLWIFFRSFKVVFWSLVVCIIGVIWSLGTLYLFGYKITILTGLIPPLIIIIGIPNCIFLITKYQEELRIHGNKIRALTRTIEKVGLSNFLANVTTSIGFFVFYFTNSELLMQFGIVAGVNVLLTNIVALIFIPIIFSYLKAPSVKQTKHLDGKRINIVLDKIDYLVHYKRTAIYITITAITLIGVWGLTMVKPIGYVVDDLPKNDPVIEHLRFFEKHFNGVLPFEYYIDTKKENGVFADNAKTLYKIKALEKMMSNYEEFTHPVSTLEFVKFAYQAYKDGKPKYFTLPGIMELQKLTEYTTSLGEGNERFKAFIDTTRQRTRVSYQMKDIGSAEMKRLLAEIQPKVDSIFNKDEYNVEITGHSMRFLKGNDYLFHHLFISLGIEIFVILILGIVLFRSIPIIVLSKLPCLIPLVITAGIMGFMNIYIKPTTILVFSIAFGIASDGTIYILAEYRNQLKRKKMGDNIASAVSATIKGTGLSMVYTNIVLFFGFSIFAASNFGGTVALGILISVTLLVSLITNLLLMPSILLSLEKRLITKEFMEEPMLEIFEESNETTDTTTVTPVEKVESNK
ncbi:MAG: MMPL family transporter [Bacteroidia bacterium]